MCVRMFVPVTVLLLLLLNLNKYDISIANEKQ